VNGTELANDQQALVRIIKSLVADELEKTRKSTALTAELLRAEGDTELGEGGFELDSLELEDCASRVAEFFRTYEAGIEDYLLVDRTLDAWSRVVAAGLSQGSGKLNFLTSGTTGSPKRCTHTLPALARDADMVVGLLGPERVISLVPPHHIYGFIYSVLMPLRHGLDLIDVRTTRAPLSTTLRGGDLLVGTPFHLKNALRTIDSFPERVQVLSSTAPLPTSLGDALLERGAERVTDVLGSSETCAFGVRRHPETSFDLPAWWSFSDDGRRLIGSTGETHPLADVIEVETDAGSRRFRPLGRLDGVVQVGGQNVLIADVAAVIGRVPGVLRSRVGETAAGDGSENRLFAEVHVADDEDADSLKHRLEAACREALPPAGRPTSFRLVSR
jgi:4-coumarate--CoA ligase (photoactive yellow protein activation family)